ncbi:serine protease [Bacteroidota bacterium]
MLVSVNLIGQDNATITINVEQLAITVVNLRREIKPNVEKIGTGSFITKDNIPYLVTASHVAKIMDSMAYVLIQGDYNKPIKINLNDLANPIAWKHHPKADLSILVLNPNPKISNDLFKFRFIPYSMINTSKTPISRNIELTVIGFPLGLGAVGYFSPLTFRTHASSGFITLSRFDNGKPQTFIVLENPSIAGYSGGPVYDLSFVENKFMRSTGGGTKIEGFIHGTIFDSTGGKLATMTPAFYLNDLLE